MNHVATVAKQRLHQADQLGFSLWTRSHIHRSRLSRSMLYRMRRVCESWPVNGVRLGTGEAAQRVAEPPVFEGANRRARPAGAGELLVELG